MPRLALFLGWGGCDCSFLPLSVGSFILFGLPLLLLLLLFTLPLQPLLLLVELPFRVLLLILPLFVVFRLPLWLGGLRTHDLLDLSLPIIRVTCLVRVQLLVEQRLACAHPLHDTPPLNILLCAPCTSYEICNAQVALNSKLEIRGVQRGKGIFGHHEARLHLSTASKLQKFQRPQSFITVVNLRPMVSLALQSPTK